MPRFFKPQKSQSKKPIRIEEPLLIEHLSDDGRGIAHYHGKIVFVEGALEGERAQVRVTHTSSRFLEAKAVSIEQVSPQRVAPQCRHADSCGACSVQYMSQAQQLAFKEAAIAKQLQQQAQQSSVNTITTLFDEPYAYRNRIRLGVSVDKKGHVSLGFRQKQSQQLVNISECPVMLPVLSQLIQPLYQWLCTLSHAPVTHIELMGQAESFGVLIRHTRPLNSHNKLELKHSMLALGAQLWFQPDKNGGLEDDNGTKVDPRLSYTLIDGLRLYYHPQDFIQANPVINAKMIEQALSLLNPKLDEHFADLFCGIGNFSLPLSKHVATVHGVEGVQTMVERAAANAAANGCTNTHFTQANLADKEAKVYDMPPVNGLLMDPPRSGAKVICENIHRLAPQRIAYISCNTATLARDAHILCEKGYQLTASGLMDMFPQTAHSEAMCLFARS